MLNSHRSAKSSDGLSTRWRAKEQTTMSRNVEADSDVSRFVSEDGNKPSAMSRNESDAHGRHVRSIYAVDVY